MIDFDYPFTFFQNSGIFHTGKVYGEIRICFDSHLFPLIHKTADSHSYSLSCRNNLTAIFIRTSRGKLQLPQCFAKCQAILVSISVLKASVGNKWSLKKGKK